MLDQQLANTNYSEMATTNNIYDNMNFEEESVKPHEQPALSTKSKWHVDNFVNRLFDDA